MNSKVDVKNKEDHGLWYDNNIDPYKGLAEIIAVTLKNSLVSQKISFVDVPYRHKTKKSFLKKINDKLAEKDYSPELMTDLAGIRVITLIEADVQKVCELIQTMFNVHPADSVNKSEKLGEEKVGYRSVHFVCDVGKVRGNLPEFTAYKGLCFEIQVRTALEHAWAEIEHDRGYKLGGKLPSHLNRRFKLLSGLLESADLEFNRLTVEIEDYANQLKKNLDKQEYELSTIGIKTLIYEKYPEYTKKINDLDKEVNLKVLKELNLFGIKNLGELDKIIKSIKEQYEFPYSKTTLGFVRELMMLTDIDHYFNEVYSKYDKDDRWSHVGKGGMDFLMQKYKKDEIESIFAKFNIFLK
ncbi:MULTISPECIES: GTP pyrophosphokinase [Acinetobacter]|uniref:GTP pyrophosphokinase n=1 Tax=Acinetobacter TaxID=469 RepID=UPI0022EA4562|nr:MULTISPECIES: RelA/SpoT domain-containing protein [Acinetobacter]MDA3451300.1 RelA/SpoT domain-containing protein [Acinetobacter sp. AOR43_HL]MDC4609118.1 RelA/SpoT domain-containing protein [Acinetobacter baumannii]MDO7199010.1 RelA/SpoT domain-containing protein [Acinetobacter pittii]